MPEEKRVHRGLWRRESITESARQLGVGFVLVGALATFLDPNIGNAGLLPVAVGWGCLLVGWTR